MDALHGCVKCVGPQSASAKNMFRRQLPHRPVERLLLSLLSETVDSFRAGIPGPRSCSLSRDNVVVGFAGNTSVDTIYGAHPEDKVRWLPLRLLHA
jgi:hypothetical protein